MTTREERSYHKAIINTLEENLVIAEKDYEKCTDPNLAPYYAGLGDGYSFALELIRKLKT